MLVGTGVCLSDVYAQGTESDLALVKALEAAIDRLQSEVDCYYEAELLETTAASYQDAVEGKYESPPKRTYTVIYAKSATLLRETVDFGQPPVRLGNNEYTNSSFE